MIRPAEPAPDRPDDPSAALLDVIDATWRDADAARAARRRGTPPAPEPSPEEASE